MNLNDQLSRRWLACCMAAFAMPTFATLKLPDQLDVSGGGPGPVAASFEAITNEVGYVVDDTFDGEITFKWSMKWDAFDGENTANSWAMFHFFNGKNGELSGLGNDWYSSQVGTFNEAGVGLHENCRQSGTEIVAGKDYTFTLVIDYHAGALDTATFTGGGFVDQSLAPGDWGFHHIRTRVGKGATNQVDFTNMSISSRGIGGITQGDPRFPSERIVSLPEKWARWPRMRIQQLEAERDQLLEKISALPQHGLNPLSDHMGYHSLFEEPGPDGSIPSHQIEIKFNSNPAIDSIALAPAFNPEEPAGQAYAFPKRFKIEVLDSQTGKFETVVNWMDEDFPDPGPYPVFFAGINRYATRVRITIEPVVREPGVAYCALGEIYLFRHRTDGRMGDNMGVWIDTEIEASDSLSMPPVWDVQYLRDGVDGFGFPLSDETVASEDLLIISEAGDPLSDKVQLTLDLGRSQLIGPLDFWPAAAPYRQVLPSFGFPQKISVEFSHDPDFKTAKVIETKNMSRSMYQGVLFSVKCKGASARYIRVTAEGLREYKGQRILGLGEILASENGAVWSVGSKVTAQGIPERYLNQLPRLVDGCSRQRQILPQGERIKGLAQRRPLDRRLAVVKRELELARADWQRIKQRAGIWAGSIICLGLVGGLVLQRRQRRHHDKRLREQISSDLHDDIGSKVAAIALASTYVEKNAAEPAVRGRGARIQAIANAMHHGLRNVLWLTDTRTDTLDQLVRKLADCARVGIAAERLSLKTSPMSSIPAKPVNVQAKRDLLLFFEEALHNAASHSNATRINVEVLLEGRKLSLTIQDNGIGFDFPTKDEIIDSPIHHGLRSMHERSKRLHGQLIIQSAPDRGTTVGLCVSV